MNIQMLNVYFRVIVHIPIMFRSSMGSVYLNNVFIFYYLNLSRNILLLLYPKCEFTSYVKITPVINDCISLHCTNNNKTLISLR